MSQVLNQIDYICLISLLKLDRLVKYLSWFEIKFGVALLNYQHSKFGVGY